MPDQKKNFLFVINNSPYGDERPYNALRLALDLIKRPQTVVRVFLIGDGVSCALAGQQTADGYYNVERMLSSVARRGEAAT
ncbi:MAG: DsrE/DsrF/TusD sulfur relay family protein [Anaerolineales bacterium]